MTQNKFHFDWYTVDGDPVRAHDLTVTPRTRVLHIHYPSGGIVWNHPDAVRVARNGETRMIPLIDVTFMAMTALRVTTLVLVTVTGLATMATALRRLRRPN